MKFELDKTNKLPAYRQIADLFEKEIRSGAIPAGTKLPTVRDLSKQYEVSNGTAIRTYAHLERLGLISMSQGRGTFVLDITSENANRKEKAVSMIKRLIADLENMAFSTKEIEIFFGLILREHNFQFPNVRLGVVDCAPEALHMICAQLRQIEHTEVFQFLLENVQNSSFPYDDNLDIVATPATHFEQLSGKTNSNKPVLQISLSPTSDSIAQIAQIRTDLKVGICTKSMRFAHIIKKTFRQFASPQEPDVYLFDSKLPIDNFLNIKDVVLLPADYTAFCSIKQAESIEKYLQLGGQIELFHYQVDKGSLLYVGKEIEEFYKKRKNHF